MRDDMIRVARTGGYGMSEHVGAVLSTLAASPLSQQRAENFPVALRVLPRRPRRHLLRVYTFARFVDDVGDTAPGDRLALLDLVADDVRALAAGRATLPPVAGLRPVLEDTELGIGPLLDLVEANRRDQVVTRYDTFADLLDYCALSAAPVGRAVLAIAGVHGHSAVEQQSDAVCAAL